MPSSDTQTRLLVIVGPTGVGKTEFAIRLAEEIEGEIVSADSRLFYRGMDIGTAKPTLEERELVPHHLIDIADPDENWSLAIFQAEAYKAIDAIAARGKAPLLVGGTGQYIRAITEGWEIPKQQPDPKLRAALKNWAAEVGQGGLHERLAVLDPAAAEKIDPRNLRRTVRALEVIFHRGLRFSELRRRGSPRYDCLQIGLNRPREELYQRIDSRLEAMLDAGFVREVEGLLAQGHNPELPCFSAIGYAQVIAHLEGETSLEEAIAQIKRQTRLFVRRQANWFKPDDPQIQWFEAGPEALEGCVELARSFLAGELA